MESVVEELLALGSQDEEHRALCHQRLCVLLARHERPLGVEPLRTRLRRACFLSPPQEEEEGEGEEEGAGEDGEWEEQQSPQQQPLLQKERRQKQGQQGEEEVCGAPTLRARMWMAVLGVPLFDDSYLDLNMRGVHAGHLYAIESDVKRTMGTLFKGEWQEQAHIFHLKLGRVLHALCFALPPSFEYIQGCNVLVGSFLLEMPEVDVFFLLRFLFEKRMPSYGTMLGRYAGLALLQELLQQVAPDIAEDMDPQCLLIPFLPIIPHLFLNLDALDDVIHLVDLFFVCGLHMVIFSCAALILVHKERLISGGKCKLSDPLSPSLPS